MLHGNTNNLSNHPINFLKNGGGPPMASNQTDPLVSPQQPGFNELMSRKHKNFVSMESDSLSEMGGYQNYQVNQPPIVGMHDNRMLPNAYMRQPSNP